MVHHITGQWQRCAQTVTTCHGSYLIASSHREPAWPVDGSTGLVMAHHPCMTFSSSAQLARVHGSRQFCTRHLLAAKQIIPAADCGRDDIVEGCSSCEV